MGYNGLAIVYVCKLMVLSAGANLLLVVQVIYESMSWASRFTTKVVEFGIAVSKIHDF